MCEILPKCVKFACNYFKNSSASGGLRPQTPYRGSAHRPRWGLPSPDPLWFCPPPIPNLLPPPMCTGLTTVSCTSGQKTSRMATTDVPRHHDFVDESRNRRRVSILFEVTDDPTEHGEEYPSAHRKQYRIAVVE